MSVESKFERAWEGAVTPPLPLWLVPLEIASASWSMDVIVGVVGVVGPMILTLSALATAARRAASLLMLMDDDAEAALGDKDGDDAGPEEVAAAVTAADNISEPAVDCRRLPFVRPLRIRHGNCTSRARLRAMTLVRL